MAYTQQQHDTLEAAIAQGALKVKYGDKEIEYRSLKDMQIILNNMKSELGLLKQNSGRRFASYSNGISRNCID
jgi:hypothetical protein